MSLLCAGKEGSEGETLNPKPDAPREAPISQLQQHLFFVREGSGCGVLRGPRFGIGGSSERGRFEGVSGLGLRVGSGFRN